MTPALAAALEVENQAGAPELGAAYVLLRDAWTQGSRDRDLLLHLLFLAWYSVAEPPFLTGFEPGTVSKEDLDDILRCVLDTLLGDPTECNDVEALFVVGVMAQVAAWSFGDEAEWDARSRLYRLRYRELAPSGLGAGVFAGRGAYGAYFANWIARGDF